MIDAAIRAGYASCGFNAEASMYEARPLRRVFIQTLQLIALGLLAIGLIYGHWHDVEQQNQMYTSINSAR